MEAVAALKTARPVSVLPFRARSVLRDVSRRAPACSTCKLRGVCMSVGLEADAMTDLEEIVTPAVRVAKGETLYRSGGRFTGLYAIRLGSFKTVLLADDGQEQVAGYHMPGEILGADGIGAGLHDSEAVALEDSEVCAISFDSLQELAREQQAVQQNLHLAAFLVDLSERYRVRGYSSSEFVLRMTREEIGSYLGLKLETVSRLLSRFQREGLLQVQGRVVKLLDLTTLRQLVEH